MIDAEQILRDQTTMETERSAVDGEWRDVAQYMLPALAPSLDSPGLDTRIQQRPRHERIYDETSQMALGDGCSVFEGEVIPEGTTYQKLAPRDPELLKNRRSALWYEQLTHRLFALRTATYSGFATASHNSVQNLVAFGLQGMWPDLLRAPGTRQPIGISYRSDPVGQLYVRNDANGLVETSHRKFTLTHRQALSKWPDNPPECAAKAARDHGGRRLDDQGEYLHVLTPNPDFDPERIDWRGKPFFSAYLSIGDRQLFDRGGYRTRRQIVSRYDTAPGMAYGRGRAMMVVPAVRGSQALMRDLITAIEFIAKPALGASDDMMDQILMYSPGGVTYGAIDPRGQAMIQRLWDDPDIAPALNLQAEVRALIARAFWQDLYVIRQEVKTHVSAAERLLRDQQRGVLLAPFKRQETEWFSPLLEVELDLMAEMGMLDDMPPEVAESGGLYQVVYDNPLARARKAEQAGGFYDMLAALTPLMQLNPAAVQEFFRRYPFAKVLMGLGPIHGVPVAWEASEEEMEAAAAEIRALAEKEDMITVSERMSEVAKNISAAGLPMGGGGA